MAGEVERLQELVDKYDNIVFFGGAGVSTESGIPDFRSQDGLYHQKYDYPPETILSHTFFMRKPEEFFKFYRDKMLCDTAKPNAAHLKLAELEQAGKLKAVITQNIDNLHQMAGSKKVLELHGSVYRNYCMKCHRFYDFAHMKASTGVPRCECGGIIKPDVVLYEEGLDNQTINEAVKAISDSTAPNRESCCDLLNRWISSINRIGLDCEKKRLLLARSITSRTSFTPEVTALNV